MNRRHFLQLGSGIVGGAAVSALGPNSAHASGGRRRTILLVHGAWHGAWCWAKVAPLLAARGFSVVTVDLPGHGFGSRFPNAYLQQPQNPLALATEISPVAGLRLADFVAHLRDVVVDLDERGSDVVIVGHSAAGIIATALGEEAPKSIRKLIYLTAYVPLGEKPVVAYLADPTLPPSAVPTLFVANPALVGATRINPNSADPVYAARTKFVFYDDLPDPEYRAVSNMLIPDESVQILVQPTHASADGWGRIPRAYIRCLQDRAIPLGMQDRFIADADALTPHNPFQQRTLDSSHSAFASQPEQLAEAIAELV